MANRNFRSVKALQGGVVELDWEIAIGASGAPTITASRSQGLSTFTRSSAGLYVATVEDGYQYLMNAQVIQIGTLQDLTFQVTVDFSTSAKTLSITCKTAAVATDPTNGTTLRIWTRWKNSSAV